MTPRYASCPAQALARRQAEFHLLAAKAHPRLIRFARRALSNCQDAEDIAQETLARAWAHFEAFDSRRSFDAWLFRIAGNLVIDHCRRRRCRQEISLEAQAAYLEGNEETRRLELADGARGPEERLMAKESVREAQGALRSLPPTHQAALILMAQERSYEQIARLLDCPVGTIRSRVYRARIRLRRKMGDYAPETADME